MNILYCGDQKMGDGLLISTISLLKNVSEPLNIYVLTASIHTASKDYFPLPKKTTQKLANLVKEKNVKNGVHRIDISNLVAKQPPVANMNSIFTPNCMLRLYADQVSELPDRLLYLDTDVICRKDCSTFYHQSLDHLQLVGVLDYYGKWVFRRIFGKFHYLNSGILLLNMPEIRTTGLFADALKLCQTNRMFMPDQTAINSLMSERKIAPRRYNEQRRLHNSTVFQHFTTSFRMFPWIHTLTVKPWEVDKVHHELRLYEYDDILAEYEALKK
ncbi:glycosyltransferase [Secundilactobacillus folii]|uniref:Glycosyltransferase family 8 protein n=1 Tax=Secundilactobacillus folii TaxID=2678357 RepID=A0A7X3C3J8_9LACO|nr:glycosyltransferase [Secundilactobacillus folii]MTV82592.1 glycosyltransferase family 8 protein [Secundilactobacillus folii]